MMKQETNVIGGNSVGIETEVTRLFTAMDQGANLLAKNKTQSYLESVVELGPYIVDQELPEEFKVILKPILEPFWNERVTKEDVRRAFQLVVLKGLKSSEQAHHHVTPDSVALFIGYLVALLKEGDPEPLQLLDLAVGTGNLLTAVLNQIPGDSQGLGVDVDDLMIQLALTNGNLQQHDLELFHQDAFRPMLIDPVDLVVGDLPVGYYPDQANAKTFKVVGDEGQAFSHHMMIEQTLTYLKPGGYAILMVPNQLFEEDPDKKLYRLIQEEAIILGFLQLPSTLFKKEEYGRSLILLRKQGEGVQKPKQALLAQLPSFTNQISFSRTLQQIQQWVKEYKSTY